MSAVTTTRAAKLKRRPRQIGGRCGVCAYFAICGGNARIRALQLTGDPWAEDPGCYLSNVEIGIDDDRPRVGLRPYRKGDHAAVAR